MNTSNKPKSSNTDVSSIAQKLGLSSITPEMGTILSQFLKTAI
jgi:hypothetical protein